MGRVLLSVSLLLLTAGLIMVAAANRYQYVSVVGPSWSGKTVETDVRRIDRWMGTPEIWVCEDVDSSQVASAAVPPPQPPEFATPVGDIDAAATNAAYLIALRGWRSSHPHVNPETMRVTTPRCGWEVAR